MSGNKKIMTLLFQTKWCLNVIEDIKKVTVPMQKAKKNVALKKVCQVPEKKVYRNPKWL
jgi:hypothetical protein